MMLERSLINLLLLSFLNIKQYHVLIKYIDLITPNAMPLTISLSGNIFPKHSIFSLDLRVHLCDIGLRRLKIYNRLLPTNCLSLFDGFIELALTGLM